MPDSQPAPSAPAPYTIDRVQQIYLEAKDTAEALAKKHAVEMEPLTKRMEVCKAWMLDYLTRQGLENAKTEHGLCYKSQIMSATVDPEGGWDALLRYVLEKGMARVLDELEKGTPQEEGMNLFMQEPALALLNHAVNKTAVKELLEQSVEVPGVKISHITQVNVRRS